MIYKASLDNLAKAITLGVSILFAVIIAGQFFLDKDAGLGPYLMAGLFLLIYAICYAFRPLSYTLSHGQLMINRPVATVKIDRSLVQTVELLEKDAIRWSVRIFGVGGLFGYYGRFANTKIGGMTWYATRRSRAVLLRLADGKKIVLTPDEPERFVADYYK